MQQSEWRGCAPYRDCQKGNVCDVDPAPWRHSVSHVDELVRVAQLAEVLVHFRKSFLFDNLCMERSHAIHFVASIYRNVSHANTFERLFLEQAEDLSVRRIRHRQLFHKASIELATDT